VHRRMLVRAQPGAGFDAETGEAVHCETDGVRCAKVADRGSAVLSQVGPEPRKASRHPCARSPMPHPPSARRAA
jgi:hypothetical protein